MTNQLNQIRQIVDLHTCIQGEGRCAGIPHILIRFTGCNLNCMFSEWICDTAYASWLPEHGKYSLQDIIDIVDENPQIKYALITGGEPTIHPELLKEVIGILKNYDFFVALETNGTKFVDCDLDLVTISPKLTNSIPVVGTMIANEIVQRLASQENHDKQVNNRYKPDQLLQWMNHRSYQFKFVCTTDAQLREISAIQKELDIPRERIYLMPEGVTNEQLQRRRPWLIEQCIAYGYNYTDRLHIVAYDNKRIA